MQNKNPTANKFSTFYVKVEFLVKIRDIRTILLQNHKFTDEKPLKVFVQKKITHELEIRTTLYKSIMITKIIDYKLVNMNTKN